MIHNWEIRIYSAILPDELLGTLTPQSPITRDGLRMTLDPHGDCLEASWQGLNVEIAENRWIQPNDIIEIWTQNSALDPFIARWSGYLVTVANPFSRTSQPFKALGLKQTTKYHHAGTTFVSDTASSMFYAALNAMTPDYGFTATGSDFSGGLTLPETTQNYQSTWDMLEEWGAAGAIVWGVDALRAAFARQPDIGAITVNEGTPGTTVTWEAGSGIDLYSKVIFAWLTGPNRDIIDIQQVTSPHLGDIGPREKLIWLNNPLELKMVDAVYSPPDMGTDANMRDDDLGTYATYNTFGSYASASMAISAPCTKLIVAVSDIAFTGADSYKHPNIDLYINGTFNRTVRFMYQSNVFTVTASEIIFTSPMPAGTNFELRMGLGIEIVGGTETPVSMDLRVHEFRPEINFAESLIQVASGFFRDPTIPPSSVTVPELLAPKPTLEIIRPDSSTVIIPVEQVEYVISKRKNGVTNIKAGRVLDPEQEITQSLIKARDQTSQDRAIRISKGV